MALTSIDDDSDLPRILNTPAKQQERAKALAVAHLGKEVADARPVDQQGCYSRTLIVTMVDGGKLVIQFRVTPPDVECFKQARAVFGEVVPEIAQIHDEELASLGIQTFAMTYMPGVCWGNIKYPSADLRVRTARSLGTVLGRGRVEGSSADVVDGIVIPGLQKYLTALHARPAAGRARALLQAHVERLVAACPAIVKLPLHYSHEDANCGNVLVDETTYEVSGVVDW